MSADQIDLAAAFVAKLPARARPRFLRLADLQERLAGYLAQARDDNWPLDPRDFVEHAAQVLGDVGTAELDSLRWSELGLALACARGNATALQAFESRYLSGIVDDEQLQLARERLFVRGPEPTMLPRVARFDGKAPLRDWTRIVVARALADAKRQRDNAQLRDGNVEELAAVVANTLQQDPGLIHLKTELARQIKAAIEQAVQALTPQQRTLLRLRYVHGTSVEQIARLHNRHRVSISRRISKTQSDLLRHTKRLLLAGLDVEPRELDATVALVHSRLELSLDRLLRSNVELA